MELELLRWVTVHPALVHLPIGLLPLSTLAYAMAAARRSERWSFVGDVALGASALTIAAAGAFGLVSWFLLEWPGGLDPWPTMHLVLGITSTVLVLGLAVTRLLTRRRRPLPRGVWTLAATIVAALVLFTGWIGGEVLVFHGGMAVQAAGRGALSPPIDDIDAEPKNVEESMHHIRASFGSANATLARAIVEEPQREHFRILARDARTIRRMARWLVREHETAAGRASGHSPGHAVREQPPEHGEHGEHDHDEAPQPESAPQRESAPQPDAHAGHAHADDPRRMARLSRRLESVASQLEQAARERDLAHVARAMGALQEQCVSCHQQLRWESDGRPYVAARDRAGIAGVTAISVGPMKVTTRPRHSRPSPG